MRRLTLVLAAALVAAACSGTTSTAARPVATLTAQPSPLTNETAWNATLTVRPAPSRAPVVLARLGSRASRAFAAQSNGRGRFRVRLSFPEAGRWTLTARVGELVLALRTVTVAEAPPPSSPLAGATAVRVCGGAGVPYPQYGLALGAGSLWVACTHGHHLLRVDPASGRIQARIPLPGVDVRVVTADASGVWAMALRGDLADRIDPATNRIAGRVVLEGEVPYLWAGAGALWAADDSSQALVRIDPTTSRTSARIQVGNGPAGFATDGRRLWILNHRENSVDRIDVATNAVTRLASGLGPAETSAAERVALREGTLWITGRGLDLIRLSAETGEVLGTTEIGPAGIDVATTADSVWVAVYDPVAELRGDPVVGSVVRVDPTSGAIVQRLVPTRRLLLTGLVSDGANVWLLDTVGGLLLKLPG